MKLSNKVLPRLALSAGIMGALFYASSCSDEFLEVAPTGVLTSELLGTPAGINQLLVGAYSQLDGNGGFYSGATNWFHGTVRGGEALKGSTAGDQGPANAPMRYEALPTNSVVEEMWRESFDGVARANLALRTIAGSDKPGVVDNEAFRNNAIGQALFLRTHYYFELSIYYNRVPYITEETPFADVATVPNTVIMDQLEADMTRAADLLPAAQDAVGKANKWAAKAYLGKIKMFQKKFAEAQVILEDVIANGTNPAGVKYALLAKYADAFNGEFDNGAESVFAVQAAANTGNINNANPDLVLNYPNGAGAPAGCCGFAQPSFDLVFSFRTDAAGLPLLDGSYRNPANRVLNDAALASDAAFTEDAGPLDPRLDHSVGRRGIPYLDWGDHPGRNWIRDVDNGGPFAPKKSVFYKSQEGTLTDGSSWTSGYTAINYNIIRFADVLLMAAEAHIENPAGDLARATELINLVRARASNPAGFVKNPDNSNAANYVIGLYPAGLDRDALRQRVRFERKLELSGEGHRFFDLVRWGIAADYLNSYLQFESSLLPGPLGGASFDAGTDEYYPIPQTQIDLQNGVLTQNPGYQ